MTLPQWGPVVGYVPGVFDLFHVGHLNLLRQARPHCDVLVAGVVSDQMCELAKGKVPVVPEAERVAVVEALRLVDAVHLETGPDKREAWAAVGFHVLFKGDDWRGTPQGLLLEERMGEVGVRVEYFPYTAHTSSTHLRRVIEAAS
ncbi:adenylyltransferase/cytidyltransferase family protein [Alteromonas gracilis]